jgi:hypothetical protein
MLDRAEVQKIAKLDTPPAPTTPEAVVEALERAVHAQDKMNEAHRVRTGLVDEVKQNLRQLLAPFDQGNSPLKNADRRIYDLDDLSGFWGELPKLLAEHTEKSTRSVEDTRRKCEEAIVIMREIRVARALLDTDAPLDKKLDVARQLSLDPDLRDAYDAAEATEDPEAARKFVADQAGGELREPRRSQESDADNFFGGTGGSSTGNLRITDGNSGIRFR